MDDKFVIRPLRGSECVLNEAHGAVVGVIEQTKAAFARLNGLLIPGFGEERALAAERLDEQS